MDDGKGNDALLVVPPPQDGMPSPTDTALLLKLVDQLQAEKAQLDARLACVLTERGSLEADNIQLRAANLAKDKQLAHLLSRFHNLGDCGAAAMPPRPPLSSVALGGC